MKGKDVYNGQNIDMFRGKKGKKLTNIRHNKELIARTTHESRGYCTYQGPCQKQRQYQEKQGHYQVYKHILVHLSSKTARDISSTSTKKNMFKSSTNRRKALKQINASKI